MRTTLLLSAIIGGCGWAQVTIIPSYVIITTPSQSKQFKSDPPASSWSLDCPVIGCGSIDSTGKYTAPASFPALAARTNWTTVTIRAFNNTNFTMGMATIILPKPTGAAIVPPPPPPPTCGICTKGDIGGILPRLVENIALAVPLPTGDWLLPPIETSRNPQAVFIVMKDRQILPSSDYSSRFDPQDTPQPPTNWWNAHVLLRPLVAWPLNAVVEVRWLELRYVTAQ